MTFSVPMREHTHHREEVPPAPESLADTGLTGSQVSDLS